MPGPATLAIGNVGINLIIYQSITPAASVTNASSTTSTYTIQGLLIGDCIDLYPQAALTTTLSIGSVWVSAANTLSVQWINSTAGTSTASPTAISIIIQVSRCELLPFGYKNFPQAIE
jgi:hypothetical protein